MSADRPPSAPVAAHLDVYRDMLERQLLSLRELPPRADRLPLQRAIEAALATVTRLSRSEVTHDDHLGLLDDLAARVAEARAELSGVEGSDAAARGARSLLQIESSVRDCKERSVDAIVADQQRTLRRPGREEGAPARLFRASSGVPALHAFERPPLAPHVDVAPAEDDDAEGEPGGAGERARGRAARARPPVEGHRAEDDHVRALARSAMEDIGILGNLRRLEEGEPWSAVERFERRLLENLDALAALSIPPPGARCDVSVLDELLRYAAEATFADGGRAFTRAFVLGCVEGEDSLRALVLGLRQSPAATRPAQREALSLASSPAIGPAMERLLWDDDPALVRIALEVLQSRREASFAAVAPLLAHPDPDVLEAAVRCLGAVPQRAEAVAALEQVLEEGALDRVSLAAAEGLLALGSASGLAFAASALEEELALAGGLSEETRAAYVRLLALAGGPGEADLLLRSVHHEASGAEAIGWFGHVGHVEPLLAKLEAANEIRRAIGPYPTPFERAAAEALVRITGVYLDNQDPALDVTLSVDAGAWRASFEAGKGALQPGLKYRLGKPYHPRMSLDELSDEGAPAGSRRRCATELALIASVARPGWGFEPAGWVARQRAEIAALRGALDGGEVRYEPGDWPARRLERRGAAKPGP